jgi:hypothetical protein
MRLIFRTMGFLKPRSWALLLNVLLWSGSGRAIQPGILEIDLLFPQNDTYAPEQALPIVFSAQRPDLAKYFKPKV